MEGTTQLSSVLYHARGTLGGFFCSASHPRHVKFSNKFHYDTKDVLACCEDQYADGVRIAAVRGHVNAIPAVQGLETDVTLEQRAGAVLDYSLSCIYPLKFEYPFAIAIVRSK